MKLRNLTMLSMLFQTVSLHAMMLSALFLLLHLQAYSQRIDTVKSLYYPNKDSWQYKMETSEDKWQRGSLKQDFQVFLKYKRPTGIAGTVSYYGNATLYWLNGVSEIELAAAGITKQNADSFIYHVTLNDSAELVRWSKPKEFRTVNGLIYAYLGKFQSDQKVIKLEIYKSGKYSDRSVSVFNSLYLPQAKLQNVVLNYNNQYLFKPHQQEFIPSNKQHHFSKSQWEKGAIRFNWSDSINHLAVEMEPTIQNDMYNVYLKRTIAGKTDTSFISNSWEMSYYSQRPFLRINSSFFNKPGKYEILVVPEAPESFRHTNKASAIAVPFTVLASETTMFSEQEMLLGLGLVLLASSLLFAYFQQRNKSRIAKVSQQREIARLQLTSVRAQLNPHFMFNALAGIQNLINKNEIPAANMYLSRFARITRSVLDEHKTELVSIAEEIKLLDDYLQMEQMRFGFQYVIKVGEGIDGANTEIPAMLLQPFAENAVKHGVAPLKEHGLIEIQLWSDQQNIVASVRDNGRGFDAARQQDGRGLELSRKRIQLLNTFHPETPIYLEIHSGTSGTVVSITLENWLAHACTDC